MLSHDDITTLLFGHNSTFGTLIQSRTVSSDHLFPVRLVPLQLAKQLKELNTHNIWTIHFYSTHAEIWLTKDWNESNSRRLAVVLEARARALHHTEVKEGEQVLHILAHKIIRRGQDLGINYGLGAAMLCAHSILTDSISPLLAEELGIADLYKEYRNYDKTHKE